MTMTSDTQEKAKATASATAEETQHVGQVAGHEAAQVADEAMTQVRHLVDETKGQLTEQTRTQRDRLLETMRTFSEDLDHMASGESSSSGLASDLVRQAAERTRSLCERLDGREPAQIMDDVRGFARRRPGTFLLGALVAGIVAGRMARGAKDGSSSPWSDGSHVTDGSAYDEPTTTPPTSPAAVPVGVVDSDAPAPQPVTGPLAGQQGQNTFGDPATGTL
jgi:hypothetical protein